MGVIINKNVIKFYIGQLDMRFIFKKYVKIHLVLLTKTDNMKKILKVCLGIINSGFWVTFMIVI